MLYSIKNYPHIVKILFINETINMLEDNVFVVDNTTGLTFECKYFNLTPLKQ